jgi:hypothetical protein
MPEDGDRSNATRYWQKTSVRRLMHVVGLGVVLYALVSIFPWPYGEREIEWTETVALASGETTVIERVQRVEIHLTSEGPSGDLAKMATVASATSPPAFPPWQAKMLPILLDRDPATGEWVLVATMYNCRFWLLNGAPERPYWGFRAFEGEWYRTEIPESFWGRSANLFAALQSRDTSSLVQATYVKRRAYTSTRGSEIHISGVNRDGRKRFCVPPAPASASSIERDLTEFGRR